MLFVNIHPRRVVVHKGGYPQGSTAIPEYWLIAPELKLLLLLLYVCDVEVYSCTFVKALICQCA